MSTVSTVSTGLTVSTVSTVSTVIARCYLHLRCYFLKLLQHIQSGGGICLFRLFKLEPPCWGPPTLSLIILRMSCPSSVTAVLEDHVRCHDALPKCVWIYRYNVTVQRCVFLRGVPLGKVSVRHLVMGERFGFILDYEQDTQEKHYNDQQHIIE